MDKAHAARLAARMNVAEWIGVERKDYADHKYRSGSETRAKLIESMREHGLSIEGEWDVFIQNQLSRVALVPVESEQGRQHLGKLIVILLHALETAVEVHGPMPKPAVPTGTIEPWR